MKYKILRLVCLCCCIGGALVLFRQAGNISRELSGSVMPYGEDELLPLDFRIARWQNERGPEQFRGFIFTIVGVALLLCA